MTALRPPGRVAAAAVFAMLLLLPVRPVIADTADAGAAKMWQLLKDSGYDYVRKTDSVWYVEEHGQKLGDYKIIGACSDDLLVIFVIVAEKARLGDMQQISYKIARLNHEMDKVKIGIDDDGDAFVRADLTLRILDVRELKDQVTQLAAAADEAYGDLQPFLKPAAKE
jgi:hypothetical protein